MQRKKFSRKPASDPSTWQTFVNEYLKDFSATGAYMRTYGGSVDSSTSLGPRMIRQNGWIRAKIQEGSQGRITLADITPERVALELARLAFFDPGKTVVTQVVQDAGNIELRERGIPLAMLDEDTRRGVTGISYDVRGNRVLKNGKEAALNSLLRLQQMQSIGKANHAAMTSPNSHPTTDIDEITMMLEEHQDDPAEEEITEDLGDEIEGEYADADE